MGREFCQLRVSHHPHTLEARRSSWTSFSDVGEEFGGVTLTLEEYERVESLYLQAARLMLTFAKAESLTVSDVQLSLVASEAAKSVRDGATVTLEQALEIFRLELREELECRLETDNGVYLHTGFDYYFYVGGPFQCEGATKDIERLGLNVDRDVVSPYFIN